MTPHNTAVKGDFAKTVFMPGDPLRAKFVAENFLKEHKLVNNVRGIQGYTGLYKGKKVSVMASGMGMPSMAIYSYELFSFFDVNNIIRIGSAGAICDSLNLKDIVLAQGACTNSNYAAQYDLPGSFAPIASFELLFKAKTMAEKLKFSVSTGNVLSSDTFYDDSQSLVKWQKMNVLAVEMETAALYMNAARLGKNALAVLSISDCPFKKTELSAQERQTSFTAMIELALEAFCDA